MPQTFVTGSGGSTHHQPCLAPDLEEARKAVLMEGAVGRALSTTPAILPLRDCAMALLRLLRHKPAAPHTHVDPLSLKADDGQGSGGWGPPGRGVRSGSIQLGGMNQGRPWRISTSQSPAWTNWWWNRHNSARLQTGR